MRLAATIAAAVTVFVAATATSIAADYSYRTIADSSDTLFLGQCPAINNFGAVAFPASEFDPETFDSEDEILRGSGGPLTTIAEESDGFTSISGNPSINDLGAVAFDGNPTGPDRELIARGSGGPLTEIARAGSAQRFDSFTADVSLNNFGRVAFTGELGDTGDEGLFEGSGGPVATRYLASTSEFAGSISPPSLNDLGRVAFAEETDDGVRGIFRQDPSGSVTTIADDTGELQSFNDRVSLNNLGRVAFIAFDDEFTREALFTGRGGALTEVASTLGDYSAFGFGGPSLNDLGRVAFQADLDDPVGPGIFKGPNPVSDAVIRTGDTIADKTVQSVGACREMLNVRGQVAVKVTFEDFTEAIIRATPRP
ncbi:MAG TPA: choice-of-anchor tandem repeat NxxGxxAF-containing protein [Thermoleophilaceae bacterium]|nr:choice-of-anchor tandem repeat NxxGxxAF-containing protein [Thermoleophilaceae bacterium]